MKKRLIQFICTALTFGMLVSTNAMADESGASDKPDEVGINSSGEVSLNIQNAMQEGVTAFKLTLDIAPDSGATDVEFEFNPNNDVAISEYRYHPETNTINIYVADSDRIFSSNGHMDIGEVVAYDEAGNNVKVDISVSEDSLELTSKNQTQVTKRTSAQTAKEERESESPANQGHELEVISSHPKSYTVVIPTNDFDIEKTDSMTVSATEVFIAYDEMLDIKVSSANNWKLKGGKGAEDGLAYHLFNDNGVDVSDDSPSATILTATGDEVAENPKSETYNIALKDNAKGIAGEFSDTLTFIVNVSKKPTK